MGIELASATTPISPVYCSNRQLMDDNGNYHHQPLYQTRSRCTRLLPELPLFFKKRIAWACNASDGRFDLKAVERDASESVHYKHDAQIIAPKDYELCVYVHYPRHHRPYLTTARPGNLSIFEYLFFTLTMDNSKTHWSTSDFIWAIGTAVVTEIPRQIWSQIRVDIEDFSASFADGDEKAEWFWSVYKRIHDIVSMENINEAPNIYWGDIVGYSGHIHVLDVTRNDADKLLHLEVLFEA
jgi:hypothetical protein